MRVELDLASRLTVEDAQTAICLCLERVSALPPPPDVLNSAMFPFFRRACDAYPVLFASEDSLSTLMRVLRRNAAQSSLIMSAFPDGF